MRDLLCKAFKRVTVPLFPYQVITVVVIPVARPAARGLALGIAGKDVLAMPSPKALVLAAGDQPPLGVFLRMELFVASILTAY